MQKLYFTTAAFFLFIHLGMLCSQPVVFEYQSDLILPVPGYVPFTDCVVDMNGDLLDDVVRIGRKGIIIDFQASSGLFRQRFFPMAVTALPTWSICAGDLDNDGYTDVLCGSDESVAFLQARDQGRYFEETVMPGYIFSQRSTMADINNDGWLDGFVCHDTDQSIPYKNNSEGQMSPDTSLIVTADRPGSYAAIWTDYNLDGHVDLYVSKCEAGAPPGAINRTNLLYKNNGDGTFTEVGALAGLDDNAQSWSTVFEDFDNDGDFDAFIVNHDAQNRLFKNNGDETFTDVIASSGIDPLDLGAWENASGDFNNDGYVDIFSQLQHSLYLGQGDMTFIGMDVPVTPGAIADLNHDGFLDVFLKNQAWINVPTANHWVKIALFGTISNRHGIGARIEIFGPWGKQMREIRSGQSYSPMNSLSAHFGLRHFDIIDSLKVFWPSGTVTTMYELPADSLFLIPEVSCVLPSPLITIDGQNPFCLGDTVALIAPDSFTSYVWNTRDTSQIVRIAAEGQYRVLCVRDDGCGALTFPVEILQINETRPTIFSPSGNTICEGDTLTLYSESGGNYIWSNGMEGTANIPVHESGLYTVSSSSKCQEDLLVSDPFEVVVLPSPSPIAGDVFALPGDSILLTIAEGVGYWYDQPVGGSLLGSGPSYQTSVLDESTSFYVAHQTNYPGTVQSGGKPDTAGGGSLPGQGGFLVFETWKPFTLLSVTVYTGSEGPLGTRFIELVSNDSVIVRKGFDLVPGKNVVELNFDIDPGVYRLQCPQGNLWRNTGGISYPYSIGEAGRIVTSSFGDDYYYYFYDWQIRTTDVECISDRTEIRVIVSSDEHPDEPGDFHFFPNPTAGHCEMVNGVYFPEDKLLEVKDGVGRVVMTQHLLGSEHYSIDLSPIPPGMYIILMTTSKRSWVTKVIKASP